MTVRLLHAEPGRVAHSVAARAAWLSQTRSVLVVSARRSGPALRREFEAAGVDLTRVFILDVTSHGLTASSRDPEHEAFVPGPAMLELIAKRAQQVIRAKAERPATVLVDDVHTFAQYNPPGALAEILRQAVAMRSEQNEHEYVFSGGEPEAVLAAARHVADEEADILASGDLTQRKLPDRGSAPVDVAKHLQPRR